MAGTWRRSRTPSKRRSSSVPADQGSCVVHPTCAFVSRMNWPILAAAASACSRWMRISEEFVLLIREVDLENAVGDEGDEKTTAKYERDVLEE